MRKKGPTKTKKEGKGAHKDQNKGNGLSKFFCSTKNSIVPRAYESLNQGLLLTQAYEMNFVLVKDFFYIFHHNDAKKFGLFKIVISLRLGYENVKIFSISEIKIVKTFFLNILSF
jgi:hypothetical protein